MKAWFDFLLKQEKKMGKDVVEKWLSPLKILNFDACNLYLEADNSFQVAFFKEHLEPSLKNEFLNNNFRPIKVHLSLKGAPPTAFSSGFKPKKIQSSAPPLALNFNPDSFDPSSTFESFFSFKGNELSYKLLLDLAGFDFDDKTFKEPKIFNPPFNPILLYGPPSSGKTHLLEALASSLTKTGVNFFYVNTKTFTEHVVSALRFGLIEQFRSKYRNIDVLLIDDIHILAKKNATQEEFFHTFNTLHMAGKLIVLTSLVPPAKLEDIEERLVSRFQWGINLTLEKVDQSGLLSILSQKAAEYSLKLTNETMSFLLKSFTSVKNLKRALQALTLRRADKNLEISLENAQYLLQDLIMDQAKHALTSDLILEKVSYQFGLRKEDLLSKGQSKELSFPRQIAIYFLRQKLALTYQKIGSIFKRDHSTIITSFKNIQKILEKKDAENYALLKDLDSHLDKT